MTYHPAFAVMAETVVRPRTWMTDGKTMIVCVASYETQAEAEIAAAEFRQRSQGERTWVRPYAERWAW